MLELRTNTLIIGASISGLACAACLQKENVDYIIIEKTNEVATPWRNHYDRLHLHTNKRVSNLPFKKFGAEVPRYPSRQEVIDYLTSYQSEFNIRPVFNSEARRVRRENDIWITSTDSYEYSSTNLILAAGPYSKPRPIDFKGMGTFPGKILHSNEYKSGREFKGQEVLVIGFGNSSCEIAIDLFEQGARPTLSVRSPVNVIPRDVLGIPVLELAILLNRLPPRVADTVSAPLMRLLNGNLNKLGLQKLPYGPLEEIRKDAKVPVLDIGTIGLIRKGHIEIRGGLDHMEGNTVFFKDGNSKKFDSIIAGIGYYRDYADFVEVDKNRFEDLRFCASKQWYFGKDGLYFCGYWISPTGQIREISKDARKIAGDIARKERS